MSFLRRFLPAAAGAALFSPAEAKTLAEARTTLAAAAADAAAVAALFDAAGLDLAALLAAGPQALADHLDALVTPSVDLRAELETARTELAALRETVPVHTSLTADHAALIGALAAAGVKLPDGQAITPEAVAAALNTRIATRAREELAARGDQAPIDDAPAADPAAGRPAPSPTAGLTGLAKVTAAFAAKAAAAV